MFENHLGWAISSQGPLAWVRFNDYPQGVGSSDPKRFDIFN